MDQVTPSRMNLALYKDKIKSAQKGHELLKKKCDALKAKMRETMIQLIAKKKNMGEEASQAYYTLANALHSAGEFHQNVREVVKKSSIKVRLNSNNVGGVALPIFTIEGGHDEGDSSLQQLGIERGGTQITIARTKFKNLVKTLIQIAGFQTSFITLDRVIKVTNRRVNALEHIVVPRFIATKGYIEQELDEISKEEFFRLKKVLENKKKEVEMAAAAKAKRIEALKAKGIDVEAMGGDIGELEDENDEDVVV